MLPGPPHALPGAAQRLRCVQEVGRLRLPPGVGLAWGSSDGATPEQQECLLTAEGGTGPAAGPVYKGASCRGLVWGKGQMGSLRPPTRAGTPTAWSQSFPRTTVREGFLCGF